MLADGDIAPVTVLNAKGASAFLIVADHAGNVFPGALDRLGITEADQARHIAWDIGIAGVCRGLAERLDATLIQQNYSRLIIDCNRPPDTPASIPMMSERTPIPGNRDLGALERQARLDEIFAPYHARIAEEIDGRTAAARPTVLIAMHSFTPVYLDEARPWHAGVLYRDDVPFASAVLAALRTNSDLVIGDNEPYAVSAATDYTLPVHGGARGLRHVGIEIRQDLLADPAGQEEWAARMAAVLETAIAACPPGA
ncbi:N-formylglutamate amidohydrolase [Xanthobacter sp. KR7-65]|uniref:N-formylglutamate amidohydrolase n=1 Tax=Xanthobacter sp. KR7-65 TaxID=3156612 RepID=UPI0032B5BB47